MFRLTFALIFFTAVFEARAGVISAEVVDASIGVNDWAGQPNLCVVVVRDVRSQALMGLVEDITDCYWTRQARRQRVLRLPSDAFTRMEDERMAQHLQGFDSQLEFFWSTAD
jgi:hypothetical protein